MSNVELRLLRLLARSIHYLSGPGFGADICAFVIFLRQAHLEFFCRVDLHKVNRRPAKSTAGQSSAIASGQFLGDFHERVQLRGAVLEVIAGTGMALQEELAELIDVPLAQRALAVSDAIIFTDDMQSAVI